MEKNELELLIESAYEKIKNKKYETDEELDYYIKEYMIYPINKIFYNKSKDIEVKIKRNLNDIKLLFYYKIISPTTNNISYISLDKLNTNELFNFNAFLFEFYASLDQIKYLKLLLENKIYKEIQEFYIKYELNNYLKYPIKDIIFGFINKNKILRADISIVSKENGSKSELSLELNCIKILFNNIYIGGV